MALPDNSGSEGMAGVGQRWMRSVTYTLSSYSYLLVEAVECTGHLIDVPHAPIADT